MLIFRLVLLRVASILVSFFFFNDTATTEIYTLSLHDALPILRRRLSSGLPLSSSLSRGCDLAELRCTGHPRKTAARARALAAVFLGWPVHRRDRKSTRLNSSH